MRDGLLPLGGLYSTWGTRQGCCLSLGKGWKGCMYKGVLRKPHRSWKRGWKEGVLEEKEQSGGWRAV